MRKLYSTKRCSKSLLVTISSYVLSSFVIAAVINVPVDYLTIQAGIDAAVDGDTVLVQPGTYTDTINYFGKDICVVSSEGRDETVLDGGGAFNIITFANGETRAAVLDGFTIQNGRSDWGAYHAEGGVYIYNSSPTIKNCIIQDCEQYYYGSAIGIWNNSDPLLDGLIIRNNLGYHGGGLAILNNSTATLQNSLIYNNHATGTGGGIYSDLVTTSMQIINCTLVANVSDGLYNQFWGGGVYAWKDSTVEIVNSIFWDNIPNQIQDENDLLTSVIYSNIQGGYTGTGNIDINPLFVDTTNVDYHLSDYSPCLGAGLDTSIVPTTDIEGNPRPNPPGSNPDMGAYENSRTTQIIVDSLGVFHGDTALVGVEINLLNGSSYSAIDISFNGFQGLLDFIELVSDSALFGQQNWTTAVNETDTLLITASAGADDITLSGTLFWLKFAVPDTLPSQFVPINILSAILNTDSIATGLIDGGIQVLWGPDAGFAGTPTSGSYPLSVTFTDTSQAGTYPIDLWVWDLGYGELDTTQNITHTYDRPGDYTVSLTVRDEYGLSDIATKQDYINIPFVHGDIDFNTNVQSYDASLILKHLVGYITLDSLQLIVGNVSSDTTFSALDATLILQWVVGLIDSLPYVDTNGVFLATGDIYMENIAAAPGVMVDIPVMIENGTNIYSFEGEIAYNTEHLQLDTLIFSDLLEGFFAEVYDDSGIVQMAGAGANSDGEAGIFAILRFIVSPDYNFDSTIVSLNKLRWNEGLVLEDVACMVLTVQLGVDNKLAIPDKFALHQNYPNPWNPITMICYDVPTQSPVTITIYDILGRQVKTLIKQISEPGYRSVIWDATNDRGQSVGAGVYLYRVQAGDYLQTKKMILLK